MRMNLPLARRRFLAAGLLAWTVLVQPAPGSAAEQAPAKAPANGRTPEYPLGDVSRWLPRVKTFLLRAECRDETTPEEILKRLRELKQQLPNAQQFDPLDYPGLLPIHITSVECAFDPKRLRAVAEARTAEGLALERSARVWDGKQATLREHNFRSKADDFRLNPKPDPVAGSLFQRVSYLHGQPPVFWWNATPEAKAEYQQLRGTPADFIPVGRDTYHGVECDVLLNSLGNQSDRYYVGVKDGRWYGAREGIITTQEVEARLADYRTAVEEFLGVKFGEDPSEATWNRVGETLRSLPADKKAAWCRLLYARVARHYTPVFEYWFSDFRDLGDGRVFPFRETCRFYNHEDNKKPFLATTRTLTVKEVLLDKPLADRLFQEPLTDGASVVDETHEPPLRYTYRKKSAPKDGKP